MTQQDDSGYRSWSGLNAVPAGLCASVTWSDVAWIGGQTTMPLVLKV
jgi:hypothetical protein